MVTWQVPEYFTKMDAFMLNEIDSLQVPYPIATWLAANGTHVIRFTCGPNKKCGLTAPTLALPINSTRPVQNIVELTPNDDSLRLLVSADHVVLIRETTNYLEVVDSFDWSSYEFLQDYPASRLAGVIVSPIQPNSNTYQVVMGFAANDVHDVGYVVTLRRTSFWSFHTMTFLSSSPQAFSAHPSVVSPRMVYYWLVQTPYLGANTNNAFVRAMGGAAENLAVASAVFKPGVTWSTSVFLVDDNGILTDRQGMGLIVSGNNHTAGFDAWAPLFSFGEDTPEVILRTPTHLGETQGYTLPSDSVRMYANIQLLWLGAVLSHNIHTNCWDMIQLDFAVAHKRNIEEYESGTLRGTSTSLFDSANFSPQTRFDTNCKPSTCNFETPGDCPPQKCWGDSRNSGFMCCKRPPI